MYFSCGASSKETISGVPMSASGGYEHARATADTVLYRLVAATNQLDTRLARDAIDLEIAAKKSGDHASVIFHHSFY